MRIYSVELAIQELDDKRMLRLRQEVRKGEERDASFDRLGKEKDGKNLGMRRCDMKVLITTC